MVSDDYTPIGELLDIEVSFTDTRDGRQLFIKPKFPVDQLSGFAVWVLDDEMSPVPGRGPFQDDDGDFLAVADYCPDAEVAPLFVPSGALVVPTKQALPIRVIALDHDQEILGENLLELEWPGQLAYSPVHLMNPVIGLTAVVADAGAILTESRVRELAEQLLEDLEMESYRLRAVTNSIGRQKHSDVSQLVTDCFLRLPTITGEDLMAHLADVAKTHGTPSPNQISILRETALELGLDPANWDDVAVDLGLVRDTRSLASAYETLELSPDASMTEVKSAYRRLLRDYHPDTVNSLPEGFREYARKRTEEIIAAYQDLLRLAA